MLLEQPDRTKPSFSPPAYKMRKILNLSWKILLSNLNRLDKPYKLNFAVTYRCNSRCLTCNIWNKKFQEELKLDEIRKFFIENNQFSWVDLTGGEIFLRKDIVEICEIIINNCRNLYLLHFPTNGLMPNVIRKRVQEIVALKPKKLIVSISLDGSRNLYKKIRGVDGWDKAVETFKLLREIPGVESYFGVTLSKYNFDKLYEIIQSVKEKIPKITCKDFHVNIAHTSAHFYENLNNPSGASKKQIINELFKFIKIRGIPRKPVEYIERKYQNLIKEYFKTEKTPIPCQAAKASFFLNPYGDIYACTTDNMILGNIKNSKFDEIWNSNKAGLVRDKIKNNACKQCWTPCEAYQSIMADFLKLRA